LVLVVGSERLLKVCLRTVVIAYQVSGALALRVVYLLWLRLVLSRLVLQPTAGQLQKESVTS
jgi:hypothetical protein